MIKVENLTQIYKSGKGIFDLNFQIKEGEVFGYLGPNGAGKSTTIRNLMGFTNAKAGTATIKGMDCRKEAAELQKYIGYLPGEITFFGNMRGLEFLEFMGNMRGLKDTTKRDNLIERLEIDTVGSIKKMSKGMKQKIGIITAFMHDPEVYIMDEPTSGLDPLMQNIFMELVEEEKGRGKTIMMSSHIFEEVQRSCDRVGIIRDGRIVSVEDMNEINKINNKNYVITVGSQSDIDKINNSEFKIENVNGMNVIVEVGNKYNEFVKVLSNCNVIDLDVKKQSLEDIFMKYYGKGGESNE